MSAKRQAKTITQAAERASAFPAPAPAPVRVVDETGLRYKQRQPGSPFTAGNHGGVATLSCFYCGKHRLPNERTFKKILGRSQAICDPTCRPRKDGGA